MKHENGGDEEKTHDENRNWTHFQTGRILSVESPHAPGAASIAAPGRHRRSSARLALSEGGATAASATAARAATWTLSVESPHAPG